MGQTIVVLFFEENVCVIFTFSSIFIFNLPIRVLSTRQSAVKINTNRGFKMLPNTTSITVNIVFKPYNLIFFTLIGRLKYLKYEMPKRRHNGISQRNWNNSA